MARSRAFITTTVETVETWTAPVNSRKRLEVILTTLRYENDSHRVDAYVILRTSAGAPVRVFTASGYTYGGAFLTIGRDMRGNGFRAEAKALDDGVAEQARKAAAG
jgi:hypothetical protein